MSTKKAIIYDWVPRCLWEMSAYDAKKERKSFENIFFPWILCNVYALHQLIPNKIFIYCDLLFIDKYGNYFAFQGRGFFAQILHAKIVLYSDKNKKYRIIISCQHLSPCVEASIKSYFWLAETTFLTMCYSF